MIVSKTVRIKIAPNNATYWKSLGYPVGSTGGRAGKNTGQELEVLIEHLKAGSNVVVECLCESCGKGFSNRFCRRTDICGSCRLSESAKGNKYGSINRQIPIPFKEEIE